MTSVTPRTHASVQAPAHSWAVGTLVGLVARKDLLRVRAKRIEEERQRARYFLVKAP